MFKGVVPKEVVARFTSGMTTQRWIDEVPIRRVRLDDLTATQPGIAFIPMIAPTTPVGGDLYPHVVWDVDKGVYYLEDGHHRVVKKMIENVSDPYIRCRVMRVCS